MSTETDREALALYPFDGSDPNLILALHAAFRAGAEFATECAPAPSVVPEAAVERAARAMQAENAPKPDPLNRDQREARDDATIATYRTLAHAALTAALPFLTAASSATRDEVVEFAAQQHPSLHEPLRTKVGGAWADALLARFNMTRKEDR